MFSSVPSSFSLLSLLYFNQLLDLLLGFAASITATSGIMPRLKKMATSHSYDTRSADIDSSCGSRRPSARPPPKLTPVALAPPPSAPWKIIPPRYVDFGEIMPLFPMICEMLGHQDGFHFLVLIKYSICRWSKNSIVIW